MSKRTTGIHIALAAALVLLAVPTAVHAAGGCPNPFWGVYCPVDAGALLPTYLKTDFGPVVRATQVDGNGKARYGNYSPGTGQFLAVTGWMDIVSTGEINAFTPPLSDGTDTYFRSWGTVQTMFGEAAWGTQFGQDRTGAWRGRWGIYNVNVNQFFPDDDRPEGWFYAYMGPIPP